MVRASKEANLVTKYPYKVVAKFVVQGADEETYEISSKELTIKVKQGEPKISLSASSNTLYRQLGNEIKINFSALLKKQGVAISEVELLNYTDDLMLCPNGTDSGEEEGRDVLYYNPEDQSIRLAMQYDGKAILKSGKTWKVKFSVHYLDQAGNVKDAKVTYKVKVK